MSEVENKVLAQVIGSSSPTNLDEVMDDLNDPLVDQLVQDTVEVQQPPQEDPIAKQHRFESHFAQEEMAKLRGMRSHGTLEGHDSVHVNGQRRIGRDKMGALKGGMDLVSSLGYTIPEMNVHFAQDGEREVRNVAFMRDDQGDTNNMTLSSSKFLTHSKQLEGSEQQYGIKGGLRDAKGGNHRLESGERGVPDQIGDQARNSRGRFFREKKNDEKANKAFAKAIVVHEMGHVLHKTQSPDIFWAMKADGNAFKGWRELATDVSQYATQNPLEFVAEVFTGTAFGITYSGAIMQKYAEFGGPSPEPQEREENEEQVQDLDQIQRAHSTEPVSGNTDSTNDTTEN